MSDSFYSERFNKTIWLTNHAIESMMKRNITLDEVRKVVEVGEYLQTDNEHGWIFYSMEERHDNLVCLAVIEKEAIVIKTVMINWKLRKEQ